MFFEMAFGLMIKSNHGSHFCIFTQWKEHYMNVALNVLDLFKTS